MTIRPSWGRATALAALALAGQLAALRMVNAPPNAVYQHLADWKDLATTSRWAVAILAVQATVCLWLGWRRRAHVVATVRLLLPGWRLIALLALVAFGAAVPTQSVGRSGREVMLAMAMAGCAALNLALAAQAMPSDPVNRVMSRLAPPGFWDRALPWGLALWTTAAAAVISLCVFERLPHIDDGVSYLFQAKTFAAGRLWLPAPPDSASFHVDQLIVDGPRWYGYGFPGWAALLAVGLTAGIPWLINPLLAGVTVVLAHAFTQRLYDRATAHAVAGLLAFSPWLLFTAGELMSLPLAGVLALSVLLAVARARERPGGAWGVAGGLSLGALALTRPLDAALLGLVAAAWAIGIGARRLAWRDLVGGVVAAATVGAMALPYNAALTGRATLAPHNVWMDRAWGPGRDRLGFGADIGNDAWPNLDPLPGHGPADVVLNLNKNVFQGNADLFGWACGSLLWVMAGVLMGHRRRGDALATGVILSFAGGYSLYWFSGGPDLGPRYWYAALVPFVVLSVRGAQVAAERLEAAGVGPRWRVYAFVALATASAAVTVLPWRAATKYYRYRGVSGDVRRLAARHHFGRALVLVRSNEREDYQSAFSLNPANLDAAVPIYAWDVDATHRARVLARFPDRPVWVIGRPDPDVPRLEVLEGALPPGSVPR